MSEELTALTDGQHSAVTEDAVELTSSHKGRISEAAFALQAVIRGWLVFDPGDADGFDRIIKRQDTRPIAVQIKRAWKYKQDSCYRINASRSATWGRKRQLYGPMAFDVLAAHLPDVDLWVFYTRAELGNRTQTTYKLPHERLQTTSRRACDARSPNNWELLDDVAQSLTNSGGTTANVPPPVK